MSGHIGKCPKCNGNIYEKTRGYTCENYEKCGFHLNYHNLAGLGVALVTKAVIRKLLQNVNDVVELKARLSGKSYKKKAWLDKGDGYTAWTIVVEDDFYNEDAGECPRCKERVLEFPNTYSCNSPSCSFHIKKSASGAEISLEHASSLLCGESLRLTCKSHFSKEKYEKEFWINENGDLCSEKI